MSAAKKDIKPIHFETLTSKQIRPLDSQETLFWNKLFTEIRPHLYKAFYKLMRKNTSLELLSLEVTAFDTFINELGSPFIAVSQCKKFGHINLMSLDTKICEAFLNFSLGGSDRDASTKPDGIFFSKINQKVLENLYKSILNELDQWVKGRTGKSFEFLELTDNPKLITHKLPQEDLIIFNIGLELENSFGSLLIALSRSLYVRD